jgi:hypothetical protein
LIRIYPEIHTTFLDKSNRKPLKMSAFQYIQIDFVAADEKAQRKQYKQAKREWREARNRQEAQEMELRAFEDAVERLEETEATLRALKQVTKDIKKSRKSSTGYLWRLINDTPKDVTVVQYPQNVTDDISYLDKVVEVYTDHLANMFRRMIVNKRAVKESITNDNIYVVETDGIRRVLFDMTFTHLDHHVETENDLAMDGLTEYNTIVNYTTKTGYHAGCSFQEILSDKFQAAFDQVSKYVQNRHKFDTMVCGLVYCELLAMDNHLMIQAVYDESEGSDE